MVRNELPVCLIINMKPQHSNVTATEGLSAHAQWGKDVTQYYKSEELLQLFSHAPQA